MLGTDRLGLTLALVTAAAVGCGSSSETTGSGGAGGHGGSISASSSSVASSSSSSSSSGDVPPVRASGPVCPQDAKHKVLAVNKLTFGEGNSGQWKKFGFNLDGLESSGISKDVCKPNSNGMPSTAYPDGDNGIDNSFGKNLLPTILGLYPTWTTDINNSITNGVFTALFELSCLPPTGDVPNLTTKLFGGTKLAKAPKFDGTDQWPVEPELLGDPTDPESSTIVFKKSSVKGSKYDSGNDVQVILTVPISTQTKTTSIKLTLYSARVIMTLDEDRKGATNGMIGGVLNTEEFVTEVKKVGALLGICQSSLFASLVDQVRQASDIMTDGTQDPNKTCDGISMGLGFEMKAAQLGGVGPSIPPGTTCP